jgi:colanic acid/amylovoran biosynthesis glycosyltransferase
MYNQVRFIPQEIENHIVCEATENLDQFGLPNIHSLLEESRWQYYWDLWLRKLGARNHLGYLVTQAKKHRAHILHSHFGNTGWGNIEAARKAKLKHLVTFYGFDVSYLLRTDRNWSKRYQDLFRHADRILCEGPHMAGCIEALGCPRDKIQVHHLGVNLDEIVFKPRIWNPKEPLRVLIAASFLEKKGIPLALEALGRIQKDVRLQVTIIGDANRQPRSRSEKRKILDVLERNGLQEKTRMLGYQPYPTLFEEALSHHIFLSPSITADDGDIEGGVPVTLIEMAATGMPVISTYHCDIPEVIHDGLTGLLAEERDVKGLVNHLTWLIEHRSQWLSMVSAARGHLEAEYDANKQGESLGDIYRGLIEG